MKKDDLFYIDHLNDDRCIMCGGRLIFDHEVTTRRGSTESAMFRCLSCGMGIKRKYL